MLKFGDGNIWNKRKRYLKFIYIYTLCNSLQINLKLRYLPYFTYYRWQILTDRSIALYSHSINKTSDKFYCFTTREKKKKKTSDSLFCSLKRYNCLFYLQHKFIFYLERYRRLRIPMFSINVENNFLNFRCMLNNVAVIFALSKQHHFADIETRTSFLQNCWCNLLLANLSEIYRRICQFWCKHYHETVSRIVKFW